MTNLLGKRRLGRESRGGNAECLREYDSVLGELHYGRKPTEPRRIWPGMTRGKVRAGIWYLRKSKLRGEWNHTAPYYSEI